MSRRHGVGDRRPTLAVWKFASCDGCQLSLLDCEDELLALGRRRSHRPFHRDVAAPRSRDRTTSRSVEGSITTPDDARRIQEVRESSRRLVTIGACATAGGIQGLRNFAASGDYAADRLRPSRVHLSLDTSTPISAHVEVDFELHGCPIDRHQLLEVLTASLAGRRPVIPGHSVCQECKGRGTVCLLVSQEDRLPRPGHPDRLRRPVPGRRPGMLRLLRAGRHRQHVLAGGHACAPGHGTGSTCPASFAPSTPARRPSSRSPWLREVQSP